MKFSVINTNSILKGFYIDNYKNRKLGRVGQEYDKENSEIKNGSEKEYVYFALTPEEKEKVENLIDSNFSGKSNEQLRKFLKDNSDCLGYTNTNKISIVKPIKISPNSSISQYINLGKESDAYKKAEENNDKNKEKLYKREYLFQSMIDETPKLCFAKINMSLDNNSRVEYWENTYFRLKDRYNKTTDPEEKKELISKGNEAVRAYRYNKSVKGKDCFSSLLTALKKKGFKVDRIGDTEVLSLNENHDNYKKNIQVLNDFIEKSSRTEFYKALAIKDSSIFQRLLLCRFHKKYGKFISGTGFDFETLFRENSYTNDLKKRDNAIKLCSQIEFVIDEVFDEKERKTFIENNKYFQNIIYNASDFQSCIYSSTNNAIEVTDSFFEGYREYSKNLKTTNQREKFFVESFCHELGHSLNRGVYKKGLQDFKDFAKKVGFEANYDYTVYSNPVKADGANDKINLAVNNLWVKKDDRSFEQNFLEKTTGESFKDKLSDKTLIRAYSNKSAQEAFADYSAFYMLNKKEIDKAIKAYNTDKEDFYKKYKNIESLSKYAPIDENLNLNTLKQDPPKWVFNGIFNDLKKVEDYHKGITFYNMELLKSVKKCLEDLE